MSTFNTMTRKAEVWYSAGKIHNLKFERADGEAVALNYYAEGTYFGSVHNDRCRFIYPFGKHSTTKGIAEISFVWRCS